MEILFSIILIIYFIVSAINKSKKKGELPPYVPPTTGRNPRDVFADNSGFTRNNNNDILAEMDRILRSAQPQFSTKPTETTEELEEKSLEDKAEAYAPEKFMPNGLNDGLPLNNYNSYSQAEEVKTVFVQQSNPTFGDEQSFERKDSVFTLSNYGRRIKGHLQSPTTARDFVIVAEILNSPKFRRARL